MEITVNGKRQSVPDAMSIRELLVSHCVESALVVVDVNQTIVPREKHNEYRLVPNDVVEIIRFVGGG